MKKAKYVLIAIIAACAFVGVVISGINAFDSSGAFVMLLTMWGAGVLENTLETEAQMETAYNIFLTSQIVLFIFCVVILACSVALAVYFFKKDKPLEAIQRKQAERKQAKIAELEKQLEELKKDDR